VRRGRVDSKLIDEPLIPEVELLGVVAGPVFADSGGQLTYARRRLA
jgi:hypothetical protein